MIQGSSEIPGMSIGILDISVAWAGCPMRTWFITSWDRQLPVLAPDHDRADDGPQQDVEPSHPLRYLDEEAFRYNNRLGLKDKHRFDLAVRQIVWEADHVRSVDGQGSAVVEVGQF